MYSPPDVRSLFSRHGLRCTRQRENLYKALASVKSHPTAEELFQMVSPTLGDGLSLATVYNTLEAFTERGLCRRIPCPGGACRYDAQMHDHVHVTTTDGRIFDVPEDLSRALLAGVPSATLREVERRLGIRVSGLSVQVVARGPHD